MLGPGSLMLLLLAYSVVSDVATSTGSGVTSICCFSPMMFLTWSILFWIVMARAFM